MVTHPRTRCGTQISDQIKDVLKSMQNKAMHPRTEILLFCSARAQLVEEIIRPSLAEGKIVISDRYADSTLAYQGYGHGYDLALLRSLLNFATGDLWPDLTLYLDLDAEEGLNRRDAAGETSGIGWMIMPWHFISAFAQDTGKMVDADSAALEDDRCLPEAPSQVQTDLRQTVAAFLGEGQQLSGMMLLRVGFYQSDRV